ncbi:MAG: alpha/beta hydrolase [Planctomycetota bacterium]
MSTLIDITIEAVALAPLLLLAAALIVTVGGLLAAYSAVRPVSKDLGWCLGRGEPTGPEDLGTTGRELTLNLADRDATTLAWELDGQQAAGPAVLFAHGHSASRFHALGMVAPLLPHASRVWTFDQRGHGDATARTCTLGVREPADISAVISELRGRLDETSTKTTLVVFGVSMGAQASLAAVANHERPNDVAGLVLLGTYRKLAEPLPGHARRKGVPVWLFVPATLAALRVFLGSGLGYDRTADAGRLPCPLLLLHGERDDLCPLPAAKALADAAEQGGVDVTLNVFPDGGHTRLFRTHAEQYTQALADFLHRFETPSVSDPAITSKAPAGGAPTPAPSRGTP